jgi:ComF family protein
MNDAGVRPLMIPVPLHSSKLRARGFNQAEKIAAAAVKRLDRAVELNSHILTRTRATESQTGLTSHQRRKNIRGAFEVAAEKKHLLSGINVILVDDVFTTGTTAEECARILLRAGAKHVWVATVARVSKLEGMPRLEHAAEEKVLQHF